MTTTNEMVTGRLATLTDADIESLRTEAVCAGDALQVALCEQALGGLVWDHDRSAWTRCPPDSDARRKCAEAIADAAGR